MELRAACGGSSGAQSKDLISPKGRFGAAFARAYQHPRPAAVHACSEPPPIDILRAVSDAALMRHALAPETCKPSRILERPRRSQCGLQDGHCLLSWASKAKELPRTVLPPIELEA